MAKYRENLPQLSGEVFLTDGGLETSLIFHDGLDLPAFAAFDLFKSERGRAAIRAYFESYVDIAREHRMGLILESPTWRASRDWGKKIGYDPEALAVMNSMAIEMLHEIRDEFETGHTQLVISGCMGPRGDGYNATLKTSAEEAERYHREQIDTFHASGTDLVSAFTMTHVDEAIGITWAARSAGMPVVISFTVETDGRLPSGQMLGSAVEQVDEATCRTPAYYMINCAHPDHYEQALTRGAPWLERIRGIRSNASCRSHAELDEATELDDGDPREFGVRHRTLKERLPQLSVLGGCCGTDRRHIAALAGQIHLIN